jgi:glyoxylase-like metal-dependent hydrolase (beta-lactamase superfamily II)
MRRFFWTGLGLASVSLAVVVAAAGRAGAPQAQQPAPAQAPDSAFGMPVVNLYERGANPYAPPQGNGEIQPWHMRGRVWFMAGGESNVAVHLGDQGILVVDSGTTAMAPRLLAQIQQLAQQRGGAHKVIRTVVNTNGRADHIGGNEILRKAGSQIIAGEERQAALGFGTPGAEVFAHENVLERLVAEGVPQPLWPTDLEGFDDDSRRFNGEAMQFYHPRSANTDGQLVVLFRESDVLVTGDIVDMTGYPVIDTARGGTIDGLLVALNRVIDMAVSDRMADGGTLIVPGHGRLATQTDVVLYKNMVTIIRNVVAYYKSEGKTLAEVLALEPSAGYDARWGRTTGSWTTRDFVTAIYNTLPAKGRVFFQVGN